MICTTPRTTALLVALVLTASFFVPSSVSACLHAMRETVAQGSKTTELTQRGQKALIYHDGEVEHLVMDVSYASDEPLEKLAWILPLPAVPTDYGTVDPGFIDEVHGFFNPRWVREKPLRRLGLKSAGRGRGGSRSTTKALELLPAQKTGPFEIQPIKVRGSLGQEKLQQWMVDNGFQRIPHQNLDYYITRKWMFLAIKALPAEGEQTLPKDGELPPLRVSFPYERAVYPMKLSAGMGNPQVTLYVLQSEPFADATFEGVEGRGFQMAKAGGKNGFVMSNAQFQHADAPEALQTFLGDVAGTGAGEAWAQVLYHSKSWRGRRHPLNWKEDLSFPISPKEPLMGLEEEPSAPEAPRSPTANQEPQPDEAQPDEAQPNELQQEEPQQAAVVPSKPPATDAGESAGSSCECASTSGTSTPDAPVAYLGLAISLVGLLWWRRPRKRGT
ncbi:DUF2330 domain-containing protein [Persicimonas caeni]|nr:DUF2330 domain-containing protein [Persicimonas caeni]